MSEALLTRRQVEARVGFRRTAIYERMAAGTFPLPIRDPISGSVRWLESEVDAWVASAVSSWSRVGKGDGKQTQPKEKAA